MKRVEDFDPPDNKYTSVLLQKEEGRRLTYLLFITHSYNLYSLFICYSNVL